MRNGPALFETNAQKLSHWFDGFSLLHSFVFDHGRITYQSNFLQSQEFLDREKPRNVLAWGSPVDPSVSIFGKLFTGFLMAPDNTSVNIIQLGTKYYTTSDISTIIEIEPSLLQTKKIHTIKNRSTMAAHPVFEGHDNIWNLLTEFSPVRTKNTIVSFDQDLNTTFHASFSTKKASYTHSFGNTPRYFIHIGQPLYLSFLDLALAGITHKSYYECYHWDASMPNILCLYDRVDKRMIEIQVDDTFFFFHTINAFEQDGKIIVDLCAYKDNSIIDMLYLKNIDAHMFQDSQKSHYVRMEIDPNLKTSKVFHKKDVIIELPALDLALSGQPYRYVYGIHSSQECHDISEGLIKYDTIDTTTTIWKEDSLIPAEPVFIRNPHAIKEDQ